MGLIAVGMTGVLEGFGLEKIGVKTDSIKVINPGCNYPIQINKDAKEFAKKKYDNFFWIIRSFAMLVFTRFCFFNIYQKNKVFRSYFIIIAIKSCNKLYFNIWSIYI